jgi:hypothetical protein
MAMMPSCVALCLCLLVAPSQGGNTGGPPALHEDKPTPLPDAFLGRWQGTLRISPVEDKTGNTPPPKGGDVPMELHIEPLADGKGHTWRIIYNTGPRREVRDYVLLPNAKQPNSFVIDERNGMLIDARLVGQGLFTQFKLQDARKTQESLILARYERRGDALEVEILAFDVKSPRVTKDSQGKYEVASYVLQVVQRAELKQVPQEKK